MLIKQSDISLAKRRPAAIAPALELLLEDFLLGVLYTKGSSTLSALIIIVSTSLISNG